MSASALPLEQLRARQMRLAASDRSRNTLYTYGQTWKDFQGWCAESDLKSLPATDDTLSLFLIHRLEVMNQTVATAKFVAAAVGFYHRSHGYDSPLGPLSRAVISATRRIRKEKPRRRSALTIDHLRRISREYAAQKSTLAIRNRAIIVFGFASAMRRSNLASLLLSDISFTDEGIIVKERSSKTDQFGIGREFGIYRGEHSDTCPVRCLKAWLRVRGLWDGPLFTHVKQTGTILRRGLTHRGEAINDIVKRAVQMIGVDPTSYGAHSLRAGCVTAAVEAGASDFAIMRVTGHRDINTLKLYVRPVAPFPQRNIFRGTL